MSSLNIIRTQTINKDILQPLDAYEKLVTFIHNPAFIRIGTIESVRTAELAATFNNTMSENVAYKTTFPRLMKRLLAEYPNLSISKQVKNYGTIYNGIGLTTDPIPKRGVAVILQKERNDKNYIYKREFLDKSEKDICQRCNWTSSQYRQMGTLGLIKFIKTNSILNIDATIYVIIGNLIQYIHEQNIKLNDKGKNALNTKALFENAISLDMILSENARTPIYTNRSLVAKETYAVGEKLQRAVYSYMNRIQSLPKLDIIMYPNLEELNNLIMWLKNNSTHRINLKTKYGKCETQNCTGVGYFGYQGEDTRFCVNHKLSDMVDVSKKCNYPGCNNIYYYAKLYSKNGTHCREHSTMNQYSIPKLTPRCSVINCQTIPYFIDANDTNIYPARCHDHKFPTDIEMVKRNCPSCQDSLYFPFDKMVCMECGQYRKQVPCRSKEVKIKYFLQSNNIPHINNKQITKLGSTKRPDFLINSKFGYIILEVDEDKHRGYDSLDETHRMEILYNDIKLINPEAQVLFIRYNPDKYRGLQHDEIQRVSYLHMLLIHFIELNNIGTSAGKIYLYYDGFDGQPKIQPIY